jgi:uncharacterized repeat protein (TIGR01451 family)
MVLNPAGTRVYVAISLSDSVSLLYTASNTVMAAVTVGNRNSPDAFGIFIGSGPTPPEISKVFGAASILVGAVISLSFTITNLNLSATLTGVAFTDTLPAGLVAATPNGLTSRPFDEINSECPLYFSPK